MRAVLLLALGVLPVVAAHGGAGPEVHIIARDGGFAFDPFESTVALGVPVGWTDDSGSPHAVTSVASPRDHAPTGRFDARVPPRSTVSLDVGGAGDVFFRCGIHGMLGILHVVAATPGLAPAVLAIALLLTSRARRSRGPPGRSRRR